MFKFLNCLYTGLQGRKGVNVMNEKLTELISLSKADREDCDLLIETANNYDKKNYSIVKKMAQKMGMQVQEIDFNAEELNNACGAIIFMKRNDLNVKQIFIDRNMLETKKVFTLAHEIAHYFLHYDDEKEGKQVYINFRSYKDDSAISKEEMEADDFASYFLMSDESIFAYYKETGLPLVRDLTDKYNVSRKTVIYRVSKLGLSIMG